MRDYNLRSDDIYGAPPTRRRLGWLKIVAALVLIGAGAFYVLTKEKAPEAEQVAVSTSPDIIPLTLPPRSPSPTAAQ